MKNGCEGKVAQAGTPMSPKVQSLASIFCTSPYQVHSRHGPMGSPGKNITVFEKDFIYLLLERGEGKERNIDWLPL